MSRKRKHFETELQPTVKLVSEGDLLVDRLLEKQLSKQSSLRTELQRKQIFIPSTEYKPISDYISGINSLNELENTSAYIRTLEEFTAAGLSKEDVDLYLDSEKGFDYLRHKHKNLDPQQIKKKLLNIQDIISKYKTVINTEKSLDTGSRIHSECMLSIKPNSIETNLLKFALNNETKTEKADNKLEPIRVIEKDFMKSINDGTNGIVDISKLQKKVQRRLRAMSNKIDCMEPLPEQNPIQTISRSPTVKNSKWDIKYNEMDALNVLKNTNDSNISKSAITPSKDDKLESSTMKSGKSGNHYTIRDGIIIKLENLIDYRNCKKLSAEEITNMPKFAQYNRGQPSKILYLKNAHSLSEIDLRLLFKAFNFNPKAIKVMKGRMKGQAFVEMDNSETAEQALARINGMIVKDKPVIVQFSAKNELT